MPVRVGPKGIEGIIEFDLDSEEKDALAAYARMVKKQIGEGQTLINRSKTGPLDLSRA